MIQPGVFQIYLRELLMEKMNWPPETVLVWIVKQWFWCFECLIKETSGLLILNTTSIMVHQLSRSEVWDPPLAQWDWCKHTVSLRWEMYDTSLGLMRVCLYVFNRSSVCVCEQNVCWRCPWRSSGSFCRSGSPRPSSTVTMWSSSSYRPPWLNCKRWSWIFLLQVCNNTKCLQYWCNYCPWVFSSDTNAYSFYSLF